MCARILPLTCARTRARTCVVLAHKLARVLKLRASKDLIKDPMQSLPHLTPKLYATERGNTPTSFEVMLESRESWLPREMAKYSWASHLLPLMSLCWLHLRFLPQPPLHQLGQSIDQESCCLLSTKPVSITKENKIKLTQLCSNSSMESIQPLSVLYL